MRKASARIFKSSYPHPQRRQNFERFLIWYRIGLKTAGLPAENVIFFTL